MPHLSYAHLTLLATLLTGLAHFHEVSRGQGFTPEEAVRRMKAADGLQVRLVASEPLVRQPLSVSFDARGRLWVIQYLQYPTPAGLKPVKVDQFLRTEYDRVPEPPPRGPKGADRITILSDPDEHGRYTKSNDFLTGLNLCTGMALGHGGVFVLQAPYLLFYPDRDGDDHPDGDPEVLLSGFGMQDAHACANSLEWGPDGWLYGTQGSTVTANIRGVEFQQGIWRYHPRTRAFELFAEGGGNTWGLDFDRHGNVIAGTNVGGNAMLHQVQGGYYVKGFGKHGPLHNPHSYGYFEHVPYTNFKGGHVTCGGILYEGGAFPDRYNHAYLAANILSNALHWHVLESKGSTFTAHFGGELLLGNDTWFRPVDCLVGPDGAVYVADWYDKRADHVDPIDNWDRSNGRIYKLEAVDAIPCEPFDLTRLTSTELVALLKRPNGWWRTEARRLLAERRDPAVVPMLRIAAREGRGQDALEALWALFASGGFDESCDVHFLEHPDVDVRAWTVRLLGDTPPLAADVSAALATFAKSEPSPVVRAQLACTAKRLPGPACLAIIRALLGHDEDVRDPYIPFLLWWAVENKAISDRDLVLSLLENAGDWRRPLAERFLVERLARRYVSEGGTANLQTCARLFQLAPQTDDKQRLVRGLETALVGRTLPEIPAALRVPLAQLGRERFDDVALLRIGMRCHDRQSLERAEQFIADEQRSDVDRASIIEVWSQLNQPFPLPTLLAVLDGAKSDNLRQAVLSALQSTADTTATEAVLQRLPKWPTPLHARALGVLFSRPASALATLQAVDTGRVAKQDVALDLVRQALAHQQEPITSLVEKHWGKIGPQPPGEKIARINSVRHILGRGPGNADHGKPLFQKTCATCHTLFGEGAKVGPELTGADRKNRDFLVTHIVDPSAVIRPEYVAYTVSTRDGRLLTGLIAEATPTAVTLLDAKNQRTLVPRDQIEELNASPLSLMPEKILDPLGDQDIRDLFAYLQGDGPALAAKPTPARNVLKVCLVSGSFEYKSDASLIALQQELETKYFVRCTRAFAPTEDNLPSLEHLDDCDVALLFTRRLKLKGDQLDRYKKYCQAGKPIVAVRTASHGVQSWLGFDKDVLGGNYQNHYPATTPPPEVHLVDPAKNHPVLAGFQPFKASGTLYRNTGAASDITVLLTGTIPGFTEPIAWTRTYRGGRVFYTSLGHPNDFADENFRRLLVNALFWTAQREMPR